MDLPTSPETELIDPDEAEILASFRSLPTEDDLPCDDGEPMETPRHREQMNLLIDSLKVHWADRTRYYVGGNMFVHYDPENKRRSRGPDFFLVLNVVDRERKSWVAWQEGMRFPDVIIELLSDTTRAVDKEVAFAPELAGRSIGKAQIHEVGVFWQWIVNPRFDISLSGSIGIAGEGYQDLARLADCNPNVPGVQPCAGNDAALKAEVAFRARF